jgi:hypothetical protein
MADDQMNVDQKHVKSKMQSEAARLKLMESKDRRRSTSSLGKKSLSGSHDSVPVVATEKSPNAPRSLGERRASMSLKVRPLGGRH